MSRYVWMASALASTWHKVDLQACGQAPVAACGVRLRGPVHRRLTGPLPDDGRILCAACAAVLAAFRSVRELHAPRSITGYFSGRLPSADEELEWPEDEPGAPWNTRGGNQFPDDSADRSDSRALAPA